MEKILDKDLSLCIIVGPGEAYELRRCLESVQGELFDEISVTVTSDDAEVKSVAEELADKVSYFEWCKDFSKARNYSFSQASGKYIMWLDADDVIKPDNYEKLLKCKETIEDHDMYLIDYIYAHDEKDNPIVVLPRERIVKNCDYIKWHDPIHEWLEMDRCRSIHKLEGVSVDHYRIKPFNPDRNLSILKEQYEAKNPGPSPRTKFYYGKELMDTLNFEEGLKVLEDFLNDNQGYRDNLAVASIKVSRYYFANGDFDKSKSFAMTGIMHNSNYAENYVVLGDISQRSGDYETAIKYYEDALGKEMNAGMSQIVDFYNFLPAANLALLYSNQGDFKKSLEYANVALLHKPDNEQILETKKRSEHELSRKPNNPTIKDMDALVGALDHLGYDISIESNTDRSADIKLYAKSGLSVTWLVPTRYVEDPATRLRRINVDAFLRESGIDSKIIFDYYKLGEANTKELVGNSSIVIFSQHSELELNLIRAFKADGKKVIFDKCEELFDYPLQNECMQESHVLLCCSTKLAEIARDKGFTNVDVISDTVEKYEPRPEGQYENRYERPKALYMGMGGNSFLAKEYLKPAIEKAGYDLVVITEWDDADKKWGLDTWADDMRECDVVLCPQRVDVQPAKSSIKAITAMALGMPVICSPLQAYKEIITNEINGFICSTVDEWAKALIMLKDPKVREAIGTKAYETASSFKPEVTVGQYKKLFRDILKEDKVKLPAVINSSNFKEPVDLIITNYNNVEYLKLFISSILMNTTYPFRIIVSDAGSGPETWEYLNTLKGMVILGSPSQRLSFSESCNAGIRASKSKYFAILNSDMVVSKGWLTNIIHKMETEDRLAACGVLSNCDRGWLHGNPNDPHSPRYPMLLSDYNLELIPGMKLDQIHDKVDSLYSFMEESNKMHKGKFVEQPWVAAYATVFARSAIEEVGLFDPIYKNGCEDLDLCRRISSFGYRIGQAIDSFVFHFGGISRGAYQKEGREEYDREDRSNHAIYHSKWKHKKIAIYTGPAWEPWTKETVDNGMAGSETWAAYLAIAFAKRGYGVVIYNDLPEKDRDVYLKQEYDTDKSLFSDCLTDKGYVAYRHHTHMLNDLSYDMVDYFISSRTVEPFRHQVHAVRRYVMIHDIWLGADKNMDIMSWKIDGYGYLSEWHKDFLKSHHSMPEDKMFKTSNGVNFDLYKDVDSYEKKNQIVYSSSPDRGLFELLKMFPKFREVCPDLKLIIAYGFYNWESAVRARGDKSGEDFINAIKKAMEQPGIEYVGRVSKDELAKLQMQSKWWFYPTWFTETQGITAIENGLAKNALLHTKLAGLITTTGGSAIMVDGDSRSDDFTEEFTAEAVRLLSDEGYTKEWSDRAYTKMQEYSWDRIVDGWLKQFGF